MEALVLRTLFRAFAIIHTWCESIAHVLAQLKEQFLIECSLNLRFTEQRRKKVAHEVTSSVFVESLKFKLKMM